MNENSNTGEVVTNVGLSTHLAASDHENGYISYEDPVSLFKTAPSAYLDVLYKPVSIGTYVWNPAVLQGFMAPISVDLQTDIERYNPIHDRVSSFLYGTGSYDVLINVQGGAAMYGRLVIFAVPRITTSGFDYCTVNNCRILPHVIVDPSRNSTYKLNLPMIGPQGVMERSDPFKSWALWYCVYNPLRSGNSSTTDVTVRIFAGFNPETRFHGKVAPFSGLAEETKPSHLIKTATKVLDSLKVFPTLSPHVTLFSSMGQGVASALEKLGYSRPPAIHYDNAVLAKTGDSWSQAEGVAHSTVLSRNQLNLSSISSAPFMGKQEEMSVAYLLSKPVLIDSGVIPLSAPASSLLLQRSVMIPIQDADNPCIASTLAAGHVHWRGNVKYIFEFIASVFHRATVVIAWVPSQQVPTLDEVLSIYDNVIVDICGNTSITIDTPWLRPEPARYSNQASGSIHMFLLTPVTTGGSSDPIAYDVLADFSGVTFSNPRSNLIPAGSYNVVSYGDWIESQDVSFPGVGTAQNDVFFGGNPSLRLNDLLCKGGSAQQVVSDTQYLRLSTAPGTSIWSDWIGILSPCFFGYRGSVKFHIWTDRSMAVGVERGLTAAGTPYTAFPWIDLSNRLLFPEGFNSSLNNGPCVTIPWLRSNLFGRGQSCQDGVSLIGVPHQPQTGSETYRYLRSAGDDYVLGGFLGVPKITY